MQLAHNVLHSPSNLRFPLVEPFDPLLSLTGLKRESVLEQVHLSLSSLQTTSVDILYLHAPDRSTPIEETLAACQQLHEGRSLTEWKHLLTMGW